MRVAVLASGRGSNLHALIDRGTISFVVSDRQCPALEVAKHAGINHLYLPAEAGETRMEYDARLQDVLIAERIDLVVLAGFMRILGDGIVRAFAGRMINIHPSLLPSFAGAHGVRDTILGGAKLAGCTTHFVTEDLDGGPIIMQAAIAIAPDDDHESLAAKVLQLEHQILPRTVALCVDGRVSAQGKVSADDSWVEEAIPGALYSDGF